MGGPFPSFWKCFLRPIWSQSWLAVFDVIIMWHNLWVAAGTREVYLKLWLLWRCICAFFPSAFIQLLLSRCERRHQGRFHANMLFGNDVIPMGSSVLSDGRRLRKGERLSLILASSNIIMKCHNPVVRLPKTLAAYISSWSCCWENGGLSLTISFRCTLEWSHYDKYIIFCTQKFLLLCWWLLNTICVFADNICVFAVDSFVYYRLAYFNKTCLASFKFGL